jgi:hypothetical protein
LRVLAERAALGDELPELTELPAEILLRPGEEANVLLPSHAGAGYVWEAVVDDEAVAKAPTMRTSARGRSVRTSC